MTNPIKCPSCKGKGHVMDAWALCLPVFGWLLAFGERNDAQGLTRNHCGQCDGKGFIRP